MKRFSLICAAAGLLLTQAFPVFATDSKAGTGAGTFMKLGTGCPRAQALGKAYSAMAQGIDAFTWNPAGLAATQQREVYFTHLSWVQDYAGKYIAFAQPVGETVIAANFAYLGIDGFDVRDANDIPQPNDNVTVQDSFVSLAVARSFLVEQVSLGAAVKRVTENNDGSEYSNMAFDLGGQARFGKMFAVGVSLQNLGNKDEVVQVNRYGGAINFGSYLTVSGEIEQPSDNKSRLGMGVEINLPEEVLQLGRFSFRLGYFDSDDRGKNYEDSLLKNLKLDQTSKLSLGIGLYTSEVFGYGLGIDYAMIPYGALGKVSQIAVKFQF